MRIDSQISSLQNDVQLQRKLTSIMDRSFRNWRRTPAVKLMLKDLEKFGAGSRLSDCPALNALVHDGECAAGFVNVWIKKFASVLKDHPLCEIPFQQSYSQGLATLRIAGSGTANLALLCYERLPSGSPVELVSFVDRERFEIVVSGVAHGQLHTLSFDAGGRPNIDSKRKDWSSGDCIELAPQIESRNLEQVEGAFTLLHLSRTSNSSAPTRLFSLKTGELQKQVSGSKASSQRELAFAVLGAMGRGDAAEAIGRWTKEGPAHLRWEALRHTLALEPLYGFECLTELTRCQQDELSRPAILLRNQLLKSHPRLAMGDAKCPA